MGIFRAAIGYGILRRLFGGGGRRRRRRGGGFMRRLLGGVRRPARAGRW